MSKEKEIKPVWIVWHKHINLPEVLVINAVFLIHEKAVERMEELKKTMALKYNQITITEAELVT